MTMSWPRHRRQTAFMRAAELRELWENVAEHGFELPTIEFYGHISGQHRSFSNFFEHAPFTFTVPGACGAADLIASGRPASVPVAFSEKAIMLCKASVMRDYASYDQILRASTPRKAKALGRAVSPWDQRLWDSAVCELALAVVYQKFASVPGLAPVLLGTGDRVIAESTKNDRNWGTGIDVGHADASRPARWRGTNILGWSLMVARAQLREDMRKATSASGQAEESLPSATKHIEREYSYGATGLKSSLPASDTEKNTESHQYRDGEGEGDGDQGQLERRGERVVKWKGTTGRKRKGKAPGRVQDDT
mmetsp:Transcript_56273/g.129202  ORF Transcript_56273/g.129202 Transcript_56273/m.129202 type:complete len:308 (-) Transcript_56273:249-1172(-)